MGRSLNLSFLALQVITLCSMIECGEKPHLQVFQMRRNPTVQQYSPQAAGNLWASFEDSYAIKTSRGKSGTHSRRQRSVKIRDAASISLENDLQHSLLADNTFSTSNSDKLSFKTGASSEPVANSLTSEVTSAVPESSTIFELLGIIFKQISFTKTLYVCEYLFSAMYGEYTSFPDSGIVYDNKTVIVIHSDTFLSVCTPLYDALNACDKRDNLTFCKEENVLLLHQHECQRQSPLDVHFEHLLAATLFEEDEECFQSVCHGSLRVVDTTVYRVLARLVLPGDQTTNGSCHRFLEHYFNANENGSTYATKNLHWSSYHPGYIVLWSEDPREHGLSSNWSYLPEYCQGIQILLTVIIGVIILLGFICNLAVVIIRMMMKANEISNILQVSIAVSDLLVNIAVLAPAFLGQAKAEIIQNGDIVEIQNAEQALTFLDSWQSSRGSVIHVNSGFHLFSAIVMSTCSINSILLLLIISFERYVVFTEISEHRQLFTTLRIRASVIVSWILGLISSLTIMYGNDGIAARWDPFSKLPIGLSLNGHKVLLYTVLTLLGFICMLTVGFSSLASYYSHRKCINRDQQLDLAGEMEERRRRQQNLRITVTLILTTALSASTFLSAGVAITIQVFELRFSYSELVSQVCWWIFFASTAWNPFLYNRNDVQFREKYSALFQSIANLPRLDIMPGRGVMDPESSGGQDEAEDGRASRVIPETQAMNSVMASSEHQVSCNETAV